MADLFHKQAKQYSETRPDYPPELIDFIASKTPDHELAWDVGTGSGQAAVSLAAIYKNVVATDTSQKQLDFAPKLPNIKYKCTPPQISMEELECEIATEASVDLVTVAQALHWFDLTTFYQHVKWVLKKPHGVIAVWCYTVPQVNDVIDSIFNPFYANSKPFWDPARELVNQKYESIEFPFEPIEGFDHTGLFEFKTERVMDLESYFTYIRSWSAYQTAKDEGIELLSKDVVEDFEKAWSEDGHDQKVVKFPVHVKIGKVGNLI
ncbi:Methyltransferase type 11 [Dillenia turbinata]|uniref:Methyltransferase type 11 n=1 Tax=Dillenia turbinata TaxID=194707 RepID=A0AAN8UDY6_9MAGN